jgi:hypothetical protein
MKYCAMVLDRNGIRQVVLFGRGEINKQIRFVPNFWYYLYYSPTAAWGSDQWETSEKIELVNSKEDLDEWGVEPSSLYDDKYVAQKALVRQLFSPILISNSK